MPQEDIESILRKYGKLEKNIASDLEQCEQVKEADIETKRKLITKSTLTYEEAVKRNKAILTDFDVVKGNLRSKAIFSPSELHWDRICNSYRQNPSLPVTTWRCHLPIFV